MADHSRSIWVVVFKHYLLHPVTIAAFLFFILLHSVALPRRIGNNLTLEIFIADMINYAIGLILLFFVLLLLLTGLNVMLGSKRVSFNHGDVMTDAQCIAAVENTIKSRIEYAEIVTAAKEGNRNLQNEVIFDDDFIKKFQKNILVTTGAQMSLDETRRYFSEWYFSQKEK